MRLPSDRGDGLIWYHDQRDEHIFFKTTTRYEGHIPIKNDLHLHDDFWKDISRCYTVLE